jgi:hypothetical protein
MGATVLPHPSRRLCQPDKFLPSSRSVAFLKSAWEEVGGYPEWLGLQRRLGVRLCPARDGTATFPFVDTAVAYFRPRGRPDAPSSASITATPAATARPTCGPNATLVRYFTYLVGPALHPPPHLARKVSGLAAALAGKRRLLPKTGAAAVGQYLGLAPPSRVRAFALIPIIRLVGDVAKMLGYPVGCSGAGGTGM